jgi:hypothetical protein
MMLTLNDRQQDELRVYSEVIAGKITKDAAALALGVDVRTVYRKCKALAKHGPTSLVHGNVGRQPATTLPTTTRKYIAEVVSQPDWLDFGPTFACEKLAELHGLVVSKETVRTILIEAGVLIPSKGKVAQLHLPRARRPQAGELLQTDGGFHEWIEGCPPFCLMIYVDDATSELVAGCFMPHECGLGYTRGLYDLILSHGVPLALYSDKHSIFTTTGKRGEPALGKPTKFGAILDRFYIQLILANSPQAKGRVENKNKVMQNRLLKEMRLEGVKTPEEAVAYLPIYIHKYGRMFAKPALNPAPAYVPWVLGPDRLAEELALRTPKRLSKNLSFVDEGVRWQVRTTEPRRLAGRDVEIWLMPDGTERLMCGSVSLSFDKFDTRTSPSTDGKGLNQIIDGWVTRNNVVTAVDGMTPILGIKP